MKLDLKRRIIDVHTALALTLSSVLITYDAISPPLKYFSIYFQ